MSAGAIPTSETPPLSTSGAGVEQALVPSPQSMEDGLSTRFNPLVMRLPVEVEVAIPLRGFRVRNLLTLDTGAVVESQWTHGDDVPVGCGNVQLAWSEFEVVDTRMAVRLTRLV